MILDGVAIWQFTDSVLYECGDDPCFRRLYIDLERCSLRVWRWSLDDIITALQVEVFSTRVEMILAKLLLRPLTGSVLYECGGRYYYINMPLIKQSILYLRGKLKIAMVLILKSLKISYCARLLIIKFKRLILGAFYLLSVSYNKVRCFFTIVKVILI